ncbi:aldehyde dehydrogenase family protein [Bradyrhizobium sp. 195]
MECGVGASLRQQHRLENVGEDPANRVGDAGIARPSVEALPAGGRNAPDGLSLVLLGGRNIGEALVDHPNVALVSATGPTAMGRPLARGSPNVLRARSSTLAGTMRDHRADGRSRPAPSRHRICRLGNGWPALHDAASSLRPRKYL